MMSSVFRSTAQSVAIVAAIVVLSACSTMSGPGIPGIDSQEAAPKQESQEAQPSVASKAEKKPEVKTEISPSMLYKLLVAEVAIQRGQVDIAVEAYLEAAKLSSDPKAAARAAQVARYAQDYIRANEAAQIWVKLDPKDTDARLTYATILIMSGRPGPAAEQYQKMLEITITNNPERTSRALNIIANQLSRIPDRSVALSVMEKIIEPYQDNPDALFSYAHLAMRQAKFDLAVTNLDKALAIRSDWPNAIILKSRILALQQGRETALKYLDEAMQGNMSDNIDVGVTYAKMLVESKKFEKAMEQFVRLTQIAPGNMDIHYPAGVLALQLNRYGLARDLLTKVMKSGKRYYEANYYLGQVSEQDKAVSEAIEHYSLVKRGDLYFAAQARVVGLLAGQKEFGKAAQHLRSIRPRDEKQELQLILLEGDLMRKEGLYMEAKKYYTQMLEQMPNETTIRYARALVAERLGEIDLVESDLQTILVVEPANAQVLNALGYTLADRTDRYEEALGYITKALNIEPDDAAIMDSMGWVLYRMGQYQEAISHLRRANEIAQDPEIAAHLGEVLWVSGNQDAARSVWDSSLKGNPDHKALIEVMKKFGL